MAEATREPCVSCEHVGDNELYRSWQTPNRLSPQHFLTQEIDPVSLCNVCATLHGVEYPQSTTSHDVLMAIVKLYHALGVEPEEERE